MAETVAFVGAAGGVGTTRVTLACAELLARDGRDTVVLDAAYETQGIADRISGTISPDMTQLCLSDGPLESGLIDQSIEGAGRFSVCPAHAPFSRLAKAKHPEAAERFETRVKEAQRHFEHVLIDTPPIAANQAVAAVMGVDTVTVVCDEPRADTAVPRTADRLADLGLDEFITVITRSSAHPDADATVPTLDQEAHPVGKTVVPVDAFSGVLEATTGVRISSENANGIFDGFPFK